MKLNINRKKLRFGGIGRSRRTEKQPAESLPQAVLYNVRGNILRFGESVLAQAADGANPIGRDVFEGGSRGDAAIRIAYGGVIDVPANVAYVFHITVLWF